MNKRRRGIIDYSEKFPGTCGNFSWDIKFDKTDGFTRVLLSPAAGERINPVQRYDKMKLTDAQLLELEKRAKKKVAAATDLELVGVKPSTIISLIIEIRELRRQLSEPWQR